MNILDLTQKVIPVLLAGLFFGAGLSSLYALGLRLLSVKTVDGDDAHTHTAKRPSALARYTGYIIFVVIALMILFGILWISKDFIHFISGVEIFK